MWVVARGKHHHVGASVPTSASASAESCLPYRGAVAALIGRPHLEIPHRELGPPEAPRRQGPHCDCASAAAGGDGWRRNDGVASRPRLQLFLDTGFDPPMI